MTNEKRRVAIDADFFYKFTENDPSGEFFLKIMNELNIMPVMHSYIAEYELAGNPTVRKLIDEKKITVYDYSDYVNEEGVQGYIEKFRWAYEIFNYKEFDGNGKDEFTYHCRKENLGELRTALMAFYMDIDLFMSDDGGAKSFVQTKLSSRRHKIDVYNVYDTLVEVYNISNRSIKWNEIKGFAKYVFANANDKYKKLNEIWHN